jgi:hypothetical protein
MAVVDPINPVYHLAVLGLNLRGEEAIYAAELVTRAAAYVGTSYFVVYFRHLQNTMQATGFPAVIGGTLPQHMAMRHTVLMSHKRYMLEFTNELRCPLWSTDQGFHPDPIPESWYDR